jgi:translation initiation factor eIF-2B subunit gamma
MHSDASSSLHIDLQTYDESQESSVGTCAILRHFSSRIKEDFILVPCDFIPPPSLPLSLLLNKFRVDVVSDGSIATTCWFETHKPAKEAFPEEWGPHIPPTSIVWDESSGTLLYVDTPDDQERDAEDIVLRMSLLSQFVPFPHVFCSRLTAPIMYSRYPRTKLSCNFQDSHVYVCRRSVLDALHEKQHFDSFREEFLPWLCKIQYQRTRREKYARGPLLPLFLPMNFLRFLFCIVLTPIVNTSSQTPALKHSTTLSKQSRHADHANSFVRHSRDNSVSVPTSPIDSDDDGSVSNSFRIGVIIHRAEAGFTTRVNTIPTFLEINRRVSTYVCPFRAH